MKVKKYIVIGIELKIVRYNESASNFQCDLIIRTFRVSKNLESSVSRYFESEYLSKSREVNDYSISYIR